MGFNDQVFVRRATLGDLIAHEETPHVPHPTSPPADRHSRRGRCHHPRAGRLDRRRSRPRPGARRGREAARRSPSSRTSSSRSWRSTTSTASSSPAPPPRRAPSTAPPRAARSTSRRTWPRSARWRSPTAGTRVTVAAGDLIGATPLLSAAFHDEPTIKAMNKMGLQIASVGNHEFDEGWRELRRMQTGGCLPDGDGKDNQNSCPDGHASTARTSSTSRPTSPAPTPADGVPARSRSRSTTGSRSASSA